MTRNNKTENRHGRLTKAEANRENAHKSTGPKTPRGKRYSRNSARTHGFYSKELLISEADKPEFEEMRAGLMAQLQPSTMLRRLAFDYCAVCQWRVRIALRLEQPQFARQLRADKPEAESVEKSDLAPVIERWYGYGRNDVRAGIGSLEYAIKEFELKGYFQEETKTFLTRGFGPDFVPLLEEWTPMSKDAILLANQLVSHAKMFGDIPDADAQSSSPRSETTKIVIDPKQGQHMVVKLLQERRNFLNEFLVLTGQNALDGKRDATQSFDFNPRFLADANRELRRALDRYLFLEDNGL